MGSAGAGPFWYPWKVPFPARLHVGPGSLPGAVPRPVPKLGPFEIDHKSAVSRMYDLGNFWFEKAFDISLRC